MSFSDFFVSFCNGQNLAYDFLWELAMARKRTKEKSVGDDS